MTGDCAGSISVATLRKSIATSRERNFEISMLDAWAQPHEKRMPMDPPRFDEEAQAEPMRETARPSPFHAAGLAASSGPAVALSGLRRSRNPCAAAPASSRRSRSA